MEIYLQKLKQFGLKLTPRRRAIIGLFLRENCHLTPEEVWKELKQQFSQCGLPSVYRNLESLAECGVLTRIQQFDRKKHYGLCNSDHDHHHHIVCVECGKVDDVQLCGLMDEEKIKGFTVLSHFMQVNGICNDCNLKQD